MLNKYHVIMACIVATVVLGAVAILSDNLPIVKCSGFPNEFPALKFFNLKTECYRYPEINGGYVWLCDNGHVEYDSTGVKFPTLESSDDTPTD